jgi:hypothetical protein
VHRTLQRTEEIHQLSLAGSAPRVRSELDPPSLSKDQHRGCWWSLMLLQGDRVSSREHRKEMGRSWGEPTADQQEAWTPNYRQHKCVMAAQQSRLEAKRGWSRTLNGGASPQSPLPV